MEDETTLRNAHPGKSLLQIHAEMEVESKKKKEEEAKKHTLTNNERLQLWLDAIGQDLLTNPACQPIVESVMRYVSGSADSQSLQWWGFSEKNVLYKERWERPDGMTTVDMMNANNVKNVLTVLCQEGHVLDGCFLKLVRTRDCDANPVAIGLAILSAGLLMMHDTGIEVRIYYGGKDSQANALYRQKKREMEEQKAAEAKAEEEATERQLCEWLESHVENARAQYGEVTFFTQPSVLEIASYEKELGRFPDGLYWSKIQAYLLHHKVMICYNESYTMELRLVYADGLLGRCLGVQVVLLKKPASWCTLF